MVEATAAKGLSALVYSPAQSKTLFKTHGEKPKGTHRFEPLKTCSYLLNSDLSRGKLYHK